MNENKRKIVILGLDALEYTLVEKWNLDGLCQVEYGKIEVPINKEIGQPISPEVWGSFLTGKNITGMEFEHSGLRETIWKTLAFLHKHTRLSFGLGRRVRGASRFPELNQKTFLDLTNSLEINAPYYSFDHKTMEIMHRFTITTRSAEQIRAELYSLFKKRKKQIITSVRRQLQNVDLIFAYIHILDDIQHFFFTRAEEIEKFYGKLDNYVSFLKTFLPASTLFIIVSDHGFNLRTGTHSNHAFYSSNKPITPKPKRITDFFTIFTTKS